MQVENGKWKVQECGMRNAECGISFARNKNRRKNLLYEGPAFEGGVGVCERIQWMIQRTISPGRNKEYREVNSERDDYIATG